MSKKDTIKARQGLIQQAFLDQLKRTPTIEQACQKSGTARTTVYRWRNDSKKFDKAVEDSLREGRIFMSDIAEAQLFALIGDQEFKAIRFYLATHNKRYSEKLEVNGTISNKDEPLTKEQKKLIREALKLSSLKNYGKKKKE